jgi:hypothetical protein
MLIKKKKGLPKVTDNDDGAEGTGGSDTGLFYTILFIPNYLG